MQRKKQIVLDRTRLLGFDQASQGLKPAPMIGAKVGLKSSPRIGAKVGLKA